MTKWIWGSLFLATVALAAGKIQNEDVKTLTELLAAGGTTAQLIHDTKIYVTANSVNTQLSTAITNGVIGGGGGNGTNYLTNSSFENGTASWTATTGAASSDSTNYTDISKSLLFTYSSQTGNIAQSVTPTTQLTGVQMQATCFVKTSLTTIQLCSLLATVETNCVAVPSTNQWQAVTSNFIGPSSGSIGVDIKTTTSTTGTFSVDQCYVGKATNTGAGAFSTAWANTLSFTVNGAGTITNSNFWWRRVGDTMEVKGSWTNGTVAGSTASIQLPSGYTIDTAKFSSATSVQPVGMLTSALTAAGPTSITTTNGRTVLFYDGSTSNLIFPAGQSGSNVYTKANGSALWNTGDAEGFEFKIPITGWTDVAVFRPEQTPASWSGYQTVAGGCSTSSTTYADPSACTTITLNQQQNRNFGTVTTAASSLPGITFTPPRAGNYLVCASGTLTTTLAAIASVDMLDSNAVNMHKGQSVTISAAGDAPFSICGVTPATAAAMTVKLQLAASTSTVAFVNGTASGSGAINWAVVEMDAPLTSPYVLVWPACEWVVDTGAGHGSSSTKILRFTNARKSLGTCVSTPGDSSTLGYVFTAVESGTYTICGSTSATAGTPYLGVTINNSALTTSINSLTYAQGKRSIARSAGTNSPVQTCATTVLAIGDVIRLADDATADDTSSNAMFAITKVGN